MDNQIMIRLHWTSSNVTQTKQLINYCKSTLKSEMYFTMNSPIYKAIEDGSFYIDLGYGKHPFTIEEIYGN